MNGLLRCVAGICVAILSGSGIGADADGNAGVAGTAERRVALVIGNAAYPGAPLLNPVNDARDMASALKKLGFAVIEKTNATQKEMNRAIGEFGSRLRADSVALFFYAGHGMQVRGKNYLIPIDAQIASEATVRTETVDVDAVMDQLAVSPLNIVILDACRNNPFERRFRSTGGGLAQMDAPKGSLIAYATAPGKVASDGSGRNGLYTQELLKHIQTPGLPLEAVFKRVRNAVMAGSGESQTPWESSSLTGDFYFIAQGAAAIQTQPAAIAPQGTGGGAARTAQQIEDELWDDIKNSRKAGVFEEYLRGYPNGRYAVQARIRLDELASASAERLAAPAAGRLPNIAGIWHWAVRSIFVADRVNTINADGTCALNTGTTCVWSVEPGQKLVFRFSDTWTHRMSLSDDGRSMSGTDDWGTAVSAKKAGAQ